MKPRNVSGLMGNFGGHQSGANPAPICGQNAEVLENCWRTVGPHRSPIMPIMPKIELSAYLTAAPRDRWCGAWVARWLDMSRGTRIVETLDADEMDRVAARGGAAVGRLAERHLLAAGFARAVAGTAPEGSPVFARWRRGLALGIAAPGGLVAFKDGPGVLLARARVVRWWHG